MAWASITFANDWSAKEFWKVYRTQVVLGEMQLFHAKDYCYSYGLHLFSRPSCASSSGRKFICYNLIYKSRGRV